jgi:uncharacterized protein with HEPN domain
MRIDDILDAISAIESFVADMDIDAWRQDRKTIDAVIRNLEVIGEASGQVPKEVQEQYPDVPWIQMRGLRNVLVHEYFGVDTDVLWQTLQEDLPGLKKLLEKMVF